MIRHLLVIGGAAMRHDVPPLDARRAPQITMARPANAGAQGLLQRRASPAEGATWYRETYFAHAGDELLLGEKSTSYLEDPPAPARAAGMLGDPHVVVILRDPVERAVSNWRFSTDNGLETRRLETRCARTWPGRRRGTRAAPRSPRSPTSSAVATSTTSTRGWRLPGDARTCCSSRSCSPTRRLLGRLWTALGRGRRNSLRETRTRR